MSKPALVVMAAGMGSRYGGLKQMDPVGPNGEFIIDYSLYDAHRAGFETVVFIIKPEMETAFRATVGQRVSKAMEVRYAFQKLDLLPEGYQIPEGRVKPWGTGHAVLSAAGAIDAPFAVINADDYYGITAFQAIFQFLSQARDQDGIGDYCMVGYLLKNTVTEHGSVSRGICARNGDGFLTQSQNTRKLTNQRWDLLYVGRWADRAAAGGHRCLHEFVGVYRRFSDGGKAAVYSVFGRCNGKQSHEGRVFSARHCRPSSARWKGQS